MQTLGYYNGKYGPIEEMMIPMNDRVHWFGDGIYDAGPCVNGHVFALDEHLDRLFGNLKKVRIPLAQSKEELKEILSELIGKMDTKDLFVYIQVTRGTAPRKHAFPEQGVTGNLWITLTPQKIYDGIAPVQAITVPDTRYLHCGTKTLNLLPNVMAAQQAAEAGCEEAIFYRLPDRVTEGAHSNVHIIQNGTLRTAQTDNFILPGISRAHLLQAAGRLGIPVREEAFTLQELFDADEVFITSSSRPFMYADRIDGKPVGGKAQALRDALRSRIMDEIRQAAGLAVAGEGASE